MPWRVSWLLFKRHLDGIVAVTAFDPKQPSIPCAALIESLTA